MPTSGGLWRANRFVVFLCLLCLTPKLHARAARRTPKDQGRRLFSTSKQTEDTFSGLRESQEQDLSRALEIAAAEAELRKRNLEAGRDDLARKLGWELEDLEEAKQRAKEARRELMEKNLGIASAIARMSKKSSGMRSGSFPTHDDLLHEAVMALNTAAEKYDPSRGVKYTTYANWWVREKVTVALRRDSRTIRIPVKTSRVLTRILSSRLVLKSALGREPTPEELAAHAGLSTAQVEKLRGIGVFEVDLSDFSWDLCDEEHLRETENVSHVAALEYAAELDWMKRPLETEPQGSVQRGRGRPKRLDPTTKLAEEPSFNVEKTSSKIARFSFSRNVESAFFHPVAEAIRNLLNEKEQAVVCCQFGMSYIWRGQLRPPKGPRHLRIREVAKELGLTVRETEKLRSGALQIVRLAAELRGLCDEETA